MIEERNSQLTPDVLGLGHRISSLAMKAEQIGKIHLCIRLELNHEKSLDALPYKLSQSRASHASMAWTAGQPQAFHPQLADTLHPRLQDVIAQNSHPGGIKRSRTLESFRRLETNLGTGCERSPRALFPARHHYNCTQFHARTSFPRSPLERRRGISLTPDCDYSSGSIPQVCLRCRRCGAKMSKKLSMQHRAAISP